MDENDCGGGDNTWRQNSIFVLEGIKELRSDIKGLVTKIDDNAKEQDKRFDKLQLTVITDITALKIKSGIWGLLGGLIPAAIILAWILIKA